MRSNPMAMSLAMPVVRALRRERVTTGEASSARYCYSVFLRHYLVARRFNAERPSTVMEFGPGDTIGVGLCWLICGASTFYAADSHRYASVAQSLRVFDALVALFRDRAPIPNDWPDLKPELDDLSFPLGEVDLSEERLERIRAAIRRMDDPASGPFEIRYFAPWDEESPVPPASVDMAYSQAVLEHVVDLRQAYSAMAKWVKPGGLISHNIDLRSHGTAFDENGHWSYSDVQWRRANNKQAYRAINRVPCSGHLKLIEEAGFEIVDCVRVDDFRGIERKHLAPKFQGLSDSDLNSLIVHVVGRRDS